MGVEGMLPRGSSLVLAGAAGMLALHVCISLGTGTSEAVVAFCAFALMIAGPIAILVWFGSLSDRDERLRARRRRRDAEDAQALLWQRTLRELEAEPNLATPMVYARTTTAPDSALAKVAAALAASIDEAKRATRPILTLCLVVASAIGLPGCGVPPEAWAAVRPGMGTAELVSLVGGPDYVRSNGTGEVWQYCRDWPGRDQGRYARYYTAVLVDRQQVREVQPYAVFSDAGCEDFYRSEF